MSQKRVAVITGCSDPDSLGAAFARDLLGRDWMVIATARNVETMKDLKARGCEVGAPSDEEVRLSELGGRR